MARWQLIKGASPAHPEGKAWYWVHTYADSSETRGGPFQTLAACIEDAKAHGLDEDSYSIHETATH